MSWIGEEDTAWDYYLGDSLGSVRQLADSAGAVNLVQTYQPFGEVADAYGDGNTGCGFTSEMVDGGLNFLRARYKDPGEGCLSHEIRGVGFARILEQKTQDNC